MKLNIELVKHILNSITLSGKKYVNNIYFDTRICFKIWIVRGLPKK